MSVLNKFKLIVKHGHELHNHLISVVKSNRSIPIPLRRNPNLLIFSFLTLFILFWLFIYSIITSPSNSGSIFGISSKNKAYGNKKPMDSSNLVATDKIIGQNRYDFHRLQSSPITENLVSTLHSNKLNKNHYIKSLLGFSSSLAHKNLYVDNINSATSISKVFCAGVKIEDDLVNGNANLNYILQHYDPRTDKKIEEIVRVSDNDSVKSNKKSIWLELNQFHIVISLLDITNKISEDIGGDKNREVHYKSTLIDFDLYDLNWNPITNTTKINVPTYKDPKNFINLEFPFELNNKMLADYMVKELKPIKIINQFGNEEPYIIFQAYNPTKDPNDFKFFSYNIFYDKLIELKGLDNKLQNYWLQFTDETSEDSNSVFLMNFFSVFKCNLISGKCSKVNSLDSTSIKQSFQTVDDLKFINDLNKNFIGGSSLIPILPIISNNEINKYIDINNFKQFWMGFINIKNEKCSQLQHELCDNSKSELTEYSRPHLILLIKDSKNDFKIGFISDAIEFNNELLRLDGKKQEICNNDLNYNSISISNIEYWDLLYMTRPEDNPDQKVNFQDLMIVDVNVNKYSNYRVTIDGIMNYILENASFGKKHESNNDELISSIELLKCLNDYIVNEKSNDENCFAL
ncbi:hypothetical protein BVG19_g2972 [[Candida] boidinii]|nr:hypothetical protein BVG19_g2972 [[Candida] boidinii]OWB50435.1 hypothetical protein B5S27_g1985 [[Candida] boidinii]